MPVSIMRLFVFLGVFELFTVCSAQIDLGTAEPYGIYGAASVTNTGATVINGDLGTGGTSVTGFPPGIINGDLAVGGQTTTVDLDATAAFTTINGLSSDADLTGQDLGNQNLLPGTYTFTAAAQLTGTLTLVGTGSANDAWYFQIGTALTTASNSAVVLNGALDCQVFWAVGSSATIGLGTSFVGTILADQSVTFGTGASLAGRAFGLGATVTLDTNVVNVPAVCAVASSSSIAQQSSTASVPATLGSTSASNTLTSTSLVPSSVTPSATDVPTDLSTGVPTSATVNPTVNPSTVTSPTPTTPLPTVQPSSVPPGATSTGPGSSLLSSAFSQTLSLATPSTSFPSSSFPVSSLFPTSLLSSSSLLPSTTLQSSSLLLSSTSLLAFSSVQSSSSLFSSTFLRSSTNLLRSASLLSSTLSQASSLASTLSSQSGTSTALALSSTTSRTNSSIFSICTCAPASIIFSTSIFTRTTGTCSATSTRTAVTTTTVRSTSTIMSTKTTTHIFRSTQTQTATVHVTVKDTTTISIIRSSVKTSTAKITSTINVTKTTTLNICSSDLLGVRSDIDENAREAATAQDQGTEYSAATITATTISTLTSCPQDCTCTGQTSTWTGTEGPFPCSAQSTCSCVLPGSTQTTTSCPTTSSLPVITAALPSPTSTSIGEPARTQPSTIIVGSVASGRGISKSIGGLVIIAIVMASL